MWQWIAVSIIVYSICSWFIPPYESAFYSLLEQTNIPRDICKPCNEFDAFFYLRTRKYAGFSTGYGEITVDGIRSIARLANERGISTFYDIGSGNGRSLLMAALLGFERVQGVEVVQERYNQSLQMHGRLPIKLQSKIDIYLGDYIEAAKVPKQPCVVFISNILWSQKQNQRLFEYLERSLAKGSIVIASTISTPMQKDGTISISMSWFPYSWCDICTVK